jgi:hypothetical protein
MYVFFFLEWWRSANALVWCEYHHFILDKTTLCIGCVVSQRQRESHAHFVRACMRRVNACMYYMWMFTCMTKHVCESIYVRIMEHTWMQSRLSWNMWLMRLPCDETRQRKSKLVKLPYLCSCNVPTKHAVFRRTRGWNCDTRHAMWLPWGRLSPKVRMPWAECRIEISFVWWASSAEPPWAEFVSSHCSALSRQNVGQM